MAMKRKLFRVRLACKAHQVVEVDAWDAEDAAEVAFAFAPEDGWTADDHTAAEVENVERV